MKGQLLNDYRLEQVTPYIEVQTASGKQVVWMNQGSDLSWAYGLWDHSFHGQRHARFVVRTRHVPVGEMRLGCYAVGELANATVRTKKLRLNGKWKVDRTQIKFPAIASWPREPLVTLREVVITAKTAGRGGMPNEIRGETRFFLNGAAMNEKPRSILISTTTFAPLVV